MTPTSKEQGSVAAGPEATLGISGLAVGLLAGFIQPLYSGIAAGAGLVLAILFQLLPERPAFRVLVRLGIGLAIGALLFFGLTLSGLVPTGRS